MRAVWSAERERELSGAQREREHRGRRYLGLFTAGLRLVFCSAGKGGLVTTSATAGFLRLVFSSGWLGRAGLGMLFTAGWLRLVVTVGWLGYAVYGGSVTTGG